MEERNIKFLLSIIVIVVCTAVMTAHCISMDKRMQVPKPVKESVTPTQVVEYKDGLGNTCDVYIPGYHQEMHAGSRGRRVDQTQQEIAIRHRNPKQKTERKA